MLTEPLCNVQSFFIKRKQKTSDLKSRKLSKILAVDGSNSSMNAVDYAITLTKKNNDNINDNDHNNHEAVEILVINIINLQPIFKLLPLDTRKRIIRIRMKQASEIFDTVDEISKRHDNILREGVKITTETAETSSGSAADEKIRYAQEKDVDRIVVGIKGRSGLSKVLLGSIASKVVTYSPCSVLVVR
jgi:nucleotide-binding universal stress UspA family protein